MHHVSEKPEMERGGHETTKHTFGRDDEEEKEKGKRKGRVFIMRHARTVLHNWLNKFIVMRLIGDTVPGLSEIFVLQSCSIKCGDLNHLSPLVNSLFFG